MQVKNGAENFLNVGSQDIGLSPMHLAWYARMAPKRYQRFTTTTKVVKNDKTVRRKVDNPTGFQVLNNGGWDYMSAAVMSRGVGWGPVLSEDCPYIGSESRNTYQGIMEERDWNWTDNEAEIEAEFKKRTNEWCKDNMAKNQDAYPSVLRLTDASFLTKPNSDLMFTEHRDELKRLIMEKGALNLTYYSAADKRFYGNGAYFYTDKTKSKNKRDTQSTLDPRQSTNHVVALIGWDDEFPVKNFIGPEQPSKPGAWLVRNSWGDAEKHDKGYFWMSYEQKTNFQSYRVDSADKEMVCYSWDPLGWCTQWGEKGKDAYAVNVFKTGSQPVKLDRLCFYTIFYDNPVTLYVKADYGTTKPTKDTVALGTCIDKDYSFDYPGYHTYYMRNKAMEIPANSYFSVAMKVDKKYEQPIAIETRV